jgi:hypothetical protein
VRKKREGRSEEIGRMYSAKNEAAGGSSLI